MLKGFFDSVPTRNRRRGRNGRLFEARVHLSHPRCPCRRPAFSRQALFCFVTAWNEFLFGYVLINDDARRTLTPAIMVFKGPHLTDWGALMAASVLAVVPVALFFVYLQRFLIEGLSTGAVKG